MSPDRKLLLTADPHLPVTERLRYYTCTPPPRPPQHGSSATDRARHIPQYLWHDWLIRFLPHRGAHVDAIATDIPIAPLIPGNPSRRRRRAAFTDIDLPQQDWNSYCDQANANPGNGGRQLNARRYIFQLLTGADLSNRHHKLAFRNSDEQTHYLGKFHRTLETKLRQAIHDHAAHLLAATGIDEPLTWSPPAKCAAGLNLPGRDPDDIDTALLRQLIVVDKVSFTAAAQRLGVWIEHTRYATRQLHRETTKHTKNTPPAARRVRERATDILDHAFFQREHIQARKDLGTISAETGFSKRILARYAKKAAVRINPGITRLADIDPVWLREQAGTLFRTNDDIAADLGLRGETVRRYRANYGIPGRPAGGRGHVVTNLTHPGLPRDIRRAVEGQRNGWQRLQRFEQMVAHPSMNSAAHAMGLHMQNPNLQLQRLEADIGAQLVHRAPHRYAPMVPTSRGRRLLKHLTRPDVREQLDRHADADAHPKCGPYKRKPCRRPG